ncbi:MAG: hypothetical protein KDD69_00515 [Bdellovibrionales bacterium]|nr:hypothetical protein [Bdellovibrionales bacterium]
MVSKESSLSLHFVGKEKAELVRVEFFCGQKQEHICSVRGRSHPGSTRFQCFNWTSAVQALALFFLNTLIAYRRSVEAAEELSPGLSGEGGSPAASLDYALARQANWLLDMFGVDSNGVARARRLLLRTNPERKRPGPVTITLNARVLAPERVLVYYEQQQISEVERLEQLADRLEGKVQSGPQDPGDAQPQEMHTPVLRVFEGCAGQVTVEAPQFDFFPRPFEHAGCRSAFASMLYKELEQVLRTTCIFNRNHYRSKVSEMVASPVFLKFSGTVGGFFEELDDSLSSAARLGATEEDIAGALRSDAGEPLGVCVPAAGVGPLALIYYLEKVKRYPVQARFRFVHAGGVLQRLLEQDHVERHEVCVLGSGHLSQLMADPRRNKFAAITLLPDISFQIIASKRRRKAASLKQAEFMLLGDGVSTSLHYYNELLSAEAICKRKSKLSFAEPHEIMPLFAETNEELRAIQWFPYYNFNQLFNGCQLVLPHQEPSRFRRNVLVGSRSFFRNAAARQALEIALRDAWLTLLESPQALRLVSELMAEDSDYLRFLARSAGLHHIDFDSRATLMSLVQPSVEEAALPIRA